MKWKKLEGQKNKIRKHSKYGQVVVYVYITSDKEIWLGRRGEMKNHQGYFIRYYFQMVSSL
jgi:hypothetical protein